MKFCDKLNMLIEEKGIRRIDIAKNTSMTRSVVYNLFDGRSKNPTLLTLLELCDVLDVNMNELLKDVDPPAPSKNKSSYNYGVVKLEQDQ